MSPSFLRLAIATVRLWTRLYTWRLPPELRDTRRDEIASDLWESQQDGEADPQIRLPLAILVRMLIGIPDDLGWRIEYGNSGGGGRQLRLALIVGTVAVLAVGLVFASTMSQLPPLPDAPQFSLRGIRGDAPPPPPPPPPPRPRPSRVPR